MIFAIFATFACARDVILDTESLLKDNQIAVVDARTNSISYVLEISPNGEITKKYLSEKDKKILQNELGLKNIKNPKILQNAKSTKNAKNAKNLQNEKSAKNANFTASKNKNAILEKRRHKSNITTWDKRKIIYEQEVETIYLRK